MKRIINYLFPVTLATYKSVFNGEVKVIEQFGQRKIMAGGLLQSGSIIKEMWQKALKSIHIDKNSILEDSPEVLILGFAGGTAAGLIIKKYPTARITAIEIDPIMIRIYNDYFKNEKLGKSLSLVEADCFDWLHKTLQKFDLILVDLYHGKQLPDQLYGRPFIHDLKDHLKPSGQTLINHIFFESQKEKVPKLIKVLETEFSDIRLVRDLFNLFIIAT